MGVARLNIDMRDDIYANLQERAATEGRSVSDVVRVLVNNWLSDKDTEAQFVREINAMKAKMEKGEI